MTIELFTTDPAITSKHTIVEFFSGKTLTVCGMKDNSGRLAIRVAPAEHQVQPDYASLVRDTLRKKAEHSYEVAKVHLSSRMPYFGLSPSKFLQRIRMAHTSNYTVLLDSSLTQGEIQEGESAVAYLLGCSDIAMPLGRIHCIR